MMRNKLAALVVLFSFVTSGLAQTSINLPAPAPSQKDDPVIISTNLIQIDATVTDKNGKFVTDLTADDFEVSENGEKQKITNFSLVKINSANDEQPIRKNEKTKNSLPEPEVSLPIRPEQVRRTIALVVDDLGLSVASINAVKSSLKKYIDTQIQDGAYQMKIVMQDTKTQKIGSASQFIQIPDLKKKRLTLSGIVLRQDKGTDFIDQNLVQTDERRELALRQFHAGSLLQFSFAVYNARLDSQTEIPRLTSQFRIFRNGREIFDSRETAVTVPSEIDAKNINVKGKFNLAKSLPPGDYVLQVIVRDTLNGKREIAVRSLDFEVTK